MSNEIQQWQAAYLGQVICIWIERAPNPYFSMRFALLLANSNRENFLKNPKL